MILHLTVSVSTHYFLPAELMVWSNSSGGHAAAGGSFKFDVELWF